MSRQNRRLLSQRLLLCAGVVVCATLVATDVAHAQSVLGKADTFLQKIVDALTGTTGKLVSTIAVVAVGLAAVFGRIEWTKALIVLASIAIIVGAPQLVSALWAIGAIESAPALRFLHEQRQLLEGQRAAVGMHRTGEKLE